MFVKLRMHNLSFIGTSNGSKKQVRMYGKPLNIHRIYVESLE